MYFNVKHLLKISICIILLNNVQCFEIISDNYYESVRNYFKETSRNQSISENKCFQTMQYIFDHYPFSAVQYIDSAAKLSSGLTGLNFFNLGDFDMCYDLENVINDTKVHGKYCLSTISIGAMSTKSLKLNKTQILQSRIAMERFSPTPRMIGNEPYLAGIHYAYCFPSTCTTEEIQELADAVLGNSALKFYEEVCYSKDTRPDLSGGAIFTIVLIVVVVFIVLISTLYEYYLISVDKKPPHDILLAFSAYSNGKKLLTTSTNPDQLLCLNGIRAISMAWVILGHENSWSLSGAYDNLLFINQTMHDKANMWLMAAPLSVDTFFTIGGLVTVYSFLKGNEKNKSFNIILYYVHRYLRLTPALGVIILIHANLLNYLGNGPLWNTVNSSLVAYCQEYWWTALLYIQNFINDDSQSCVPQSWYLSVDFQIFIFSPIVLYPLVKWPKIGVTIIGILIPLGFIIPTVISYHYELVGFIFSSVGGDFQTHLTDYMKRYYSQAYTRFGPYVIGMAFGLLIYKIKSQKMKFAKTKRNVLIALCLWLITLAGLVACVYGGADLMVKDEYDRVGSAFYNGFNRNAWAIALGLMILLLVTDFGGPINTLLSFSVFQFLAKISYSMYLVHYCFMGLRVASLRKEIHYSIFGAMHVFWGDFMYTMVLSILLCLCFESPIIILEKYLLGGGSSKKSQKTVQKSSEPTV